MLDRTLTFVLAGGVGSRLHPLTADRAKPAVPFGGKYRIIDFTLSNCHHSGLRRILVLTQYKSHSLQKHLRDGWSIYNPSIGEYVTPVPPQMRTGDSWYQGTADAVYQNLFLLERSDAEYVLLLSGDHVYRMDYAEMIRAHVKRGADVTIGCMRVPVAEASAFGIMEVDPLDRIVAFEEKPDVASSLPSDPRHALASMGIYVFSRRVLCDALEVDHERIDSTHDFGHDLIGRLVEEREVAAYRFGGARGRVSADAYWRDVGTVDAYYEANMDLLSSVPPVDLYQRNWSIRTTEVQSAPARAVDAPDGTPVVVDNVLVDAGTVVTGATVSHSILSRRVRVEPNAFVENTILFDDVEVGAGARLRRCIVDKNVRIPPGTEIGFRPADDRRRFHVSRSGIAVVPKNHDFSGHAIVREPHVPLANGSRPIGDEHA